MSCPILALDQGKLQGSISTTIDGLNYFKFQGIPYAKPPIGNLRFKPPEPLECWKGVLDATKEGSPCFNLDVYTKSTLEGSENCLFLNIYTNELEPSILKPVMFWIHGGGFYFGSGTSQLYGPDFLLIEDVVLVTINYRLGIFGFLSLEDLSLDIPGNAGLKDMILALEWVQKNIAQFGGDHKNVTIFGESAGAVSVHLLVLSPLSKGLFHKAIAQSACALNLSANKDVSSKLASALGLDTFDDGKILQALTSLSTKDIYELSSKIQQSLNEKDQGALIGWVIEKPSAKAFLAEDPIQLILGGNYNHVPLIMGYNSVESMIFEFMGIQGEERYVPPFFGYPPKAQEAVGQMQKFYKGGSEEKHRELISDKVFLFPILFSARSHANTSLQPIYGYRLSLDTKLNFLKALMAFPAISGAFHSDDLGYLFKNYLTPEIQAGSIEDLCRRKLVRLWCNFAKFGNPTPIKDDLLQKIQWKPMSKTEINLLGIDDNLVMLQGQFPESQRLAFWDQLFENSPAGLKLQTLLK